MRIAYAAKESRATEAQDLISGKIATDGVGDISDIFERFEL